MNDFSIEFTIFIWGKHGKSFIYQSLISLSRMDYPKDRFEIIFIDNSFDMKRKNTAETVALENNLRLRYIKANNMNTSQALNRSLKFGRGKFFVFTHDDCVFPPQWLNIIHKNLPGDYVGVFGGPDVSISKDTFIERCYDYVISSSLVSAGLRNKKSPFSAHYYPRMWNMVIPKDVIHRVGRFNETLNYFQDIDMINRIEKIGYQIKYDAEAFIWHHRVTTLGSLLKKDIALGSESYLYGIKKRPYALLAFFLFFVLTSLAMSFWLKELLFIVGIPLGIYFLLLFAMGFHALFKLRNFLALFVIPTFVFLIHFSKGWGYLSSLIRKTLMG